MLRHRTPVTSGNGGSGNDMMLITDNEDLLEFSPGILKHFQFFLREPRSGGHTQCCQKMVARTEVVHNLFTKGERGKVHWATAFLTRCRRVALLEAVGKMCVE